MLILMFLISLSALADSTSVFTFDKSYPRDNVFCSHKGKRMEVLIRGGNKFTEPKDRGYGEFLFYRSNKRMKPELLPLNANRSDTLKFFLGTSPLCTKVHGYEIDATTLAVLFHKENRPFSDKLVIQLFSFPDLVPRDAIETNYAVDKALKTKTGFAFRVVHENDNVDIGKVKIGDESYIYKEDFLPVWMEYSKKGFDIEQTMTFKKLPWKKVFKDQSDFESTLGWSSTDKKYYKSTLYLAVNHKIRKRCFLFLEQKKKVSSEDSWRCHDL